MAVMHAKAKRGFTLMELLVVISIIALLVSILLPSLNSAKALARLTVCSATMHNLALGNAMYSTDYEEFSVHGEEHIFGWNETGYDNKFYPSPYFDDDRGASKPGVIGSGYVNLFNDGGQNICSVGQLMWDHYIEETAAAIGCPQADFPEAVLYSGTHKEEHPATYQDVVKVMKQPKIDSDHPLPGQDPNDYWRNEYFDGDGTWRGYKYLRCNYTVRGPMFRAGDIMSHSPVKYTQPQLKNVQGRSKGDSEIAIFADHERVSYNLYLALNSSWIGWSNYHPAGMPAVPYWPRKHISGINVAYVDGHAALFFDENRAKTWDWRYKGRTPSNETKFYGNGWALMHHIYDAEN